MILGSKAGEVAGTGGITDAISTTRDSLYEVGNVLSLHAFTVGEATLREATSGELVPRLYADVRNLRDAYYAASAPHLLADFEQEASTLIDRRSTIFSVVSNGQTLASLRLTGKPYELEAYNLHQYDFSTLTDFLEVGRLVTHPDLDQVTAALIVRYLLCGSGLFAIENLNCRGLVAMCRPFRVSFFTKFGMTERAEFFCEKRKIVYRLLSSSMDEILLATARMQTNEAALRQRLKRKFKEAGAQ